MKIIMKVTDSSNAMVTKGGSKASGRTGWIDIESFQWGKGAYKHSNFSGKQLSFTEAVFIKEPDNASQWLLLASLYKGRDPVKIIIEFSSPGKTFTFVLVDVQFDQVVTQHSAGLLTETYSIYFSRVSFTQASVQSH